MSDTAPPPAWQMTPEELAGKPARKRRIEREHIAQKHARLFVRDAVTAEHEFFAFDRSQAVGHAAMLNAMREKARGLRRATPDTLLRVAGMRNIWCEWKAPGEKPTAEQCEMGGRLGALGDIWFWCVSVEQYYQYLVLYGVPLRPSAAFLALHHDGSVRTEIAKAEAKAGAPLKPSRSKPRATAGRIRRAHAAGVWTP